MRPFELSLAEASAAVRSRELSPVELLDSVLTRLTETEPRLNAYVTVDADRARAAAARAEREIARSGVRGPLHGIPFGLKDLIDVAGLPTTAGSRVREGHRAGTDSVVAARLAAAGAVLVGKTHTHEFAFGLITPQTVNARAEGHIAGGSSGGSAVAVAAGTAAFALGTDTGGSIRVPAALNGVVGLKPTYGLVPRDGVVPLSGSLDHVGPLTRTVEDAALVLPVLTGEATPPAARDLAGLRVGVPRNHYFEHVHPEVETVVRRSIEGLAALGARLVEVEVPMARYFQAIQWGLMVPEAAAYHERTLHAVPELYTADVRVLLEAGRRLPAGDHLRARHAQALLRERWLRLLDEVDVLAAPAVPMTAVPTGQETVTWSDGTAETVSDAYVRLSAPANIAGVPALTVPVGADSAGLPVGLQLMGRPHEEALLLRAGQACERSMAVAGGGGLKVGP
ncbi:amidase [Amycolatopsis sp. PS_44_ISF1]|uniref:amidase n=1 Tax=Amycolatopsis sp. PS_44_ISF1 TaxID=2974917 RepID=UPI0028DFC040|nr:amidase [Amycolatopsis sp. PS_44_ISF1]MDT8913192.1 amidase [Amycolatopsis sp. PS_44_ISF1]